MTWCWSCRRTVLNWTRTVRGKWWPCCSSCSRTRTERCRTWLWNGKCGLLMRRQTRSDEEPLIRTMTKARHVILKGFVIQTIQYVWWFMMVSPIQNYYCLTECFPSFVHSCLCFFVQHTAIPVHRKTDFILLFWTFSLAPLVSKVKEPQMEAMVDTLCSNMISDKEQLRDISSMGLKTVIAELPLSSAGEALQPEKYISLNTTWIYPLLCILSRFKSDHHCV